MVKIRPALAEDLDYWFSLDKHLKRQMFLNKLNLNECYIIENLNKKVGKMKYKEISKFPVVKKDLAVLVDKKVSAQELLKTIKNSGGKLLQKENERIRI